MSAYYNEIDPFAAQWLRNLISAGHIAPGDVDERSIVDVRADDLIGYTQCHFFAGIGVWSRALRQAGWADDRPAWTGSCPCQPFSSAGKGAGFADERHLWPAFRRLIGERRPPVVFGEQVAAKAADAWIDLVHADLEAMGYAFGCIPFPAAGIGAPHIRDRAYWVANTNQNRFSALPINAGDHAEHHAKSRCEFGGMANTNSRQQQGVAVLRGDERDGTDAGWPQGGRGASSRSEHDRMGDTGVARLAQRERFTRLSCEQDGSGARQAAERAGIHDASRASPTNGFWRNADWLGCRDGKWRPVEPGTFPLAHGAAARVGRLRAYGNAICAPQAQVFIECVMEME